MQNVIGTAIHDPWMFFLSLGFVEEFSIGVIRCLHGSTLSNGGFQHKRPIH
jgi:hypothetical protein